MEEKRKHSRLAKKIKSEVHSPEGITFSSTVDLSQGGIFISTPEPINNGSVVDLSVYIPGEEPVSVKGIVRWTRENESTKQRAGMGIEFTGLDAKQREALKKIK